MVDSVPPDKGCEVEWDGKMNDEEWDKNGNKKVADSDDNHHVIKLGGLLQNAKTISKSAI